jgi:hypothetical protein
VKEPSLPDATNADEELPPLAGEATRITSSSNGVDTAAADAEDPPAPPPTDAAPTKEPRTPTIPSPMPVLGGATYEMPAVRTNEESTEEKPPLASLSTLVVQKLADAPTPKSQPQLSEPRVTLKTMSAATAPRGWDTVAGDATRSVMVPSRWVWILLGVIAGMSAALLVVYLLRR